MKIVFSQFHGILNLLSKSFETLKKFLFRQPSMSGIWKDQSNEPTKVLWNPRVNKKNKKKHKMELT